MTFSSRVSSEISLTRGAMALYAAVSIVMSSTHTMNAIAKTFAMMIRVPAADEQRRSFVRITYRM